MADRSSQAHLLRHLSGRPVRMSGRERAHHHRHYFPHHRLRDIVPSSRFRLICKPLDLSNDKSLPNPADLGSRQRQPPGDLCSGHAVRGHQDHTSPPNTARRRRGLNRQRLKASPLSYRQVKGGRLAHADSYNSTSFMAASILRADNQRRPRPPRAAPSPRATSPLKTIFVLQHHYSDGQHAF